ncbi:MAG: DUF192 domain-containing protein [Nanoarchaeota archaeon]
MIKLFPILLVLMLLTGCSQVTKKVIINEKSFNVEIADNQIERAQGLMFRKELEENSGMLFLFESSGKHSFWMKNTLIPLDMIWIDENLEIVFIFENAQPCEETCDSITPDKNAKYVLEINSGLVEKYNFKIGDEIKII